MGILNFLKKKPETGTADLPPPPPPPTKGLDLELPEAPGLPPLTGLGNEPAPTLRPSQMMAPMTEQPIPTVTGNGEEHEEPHMMMQAPQETQEEAHYAPELPDLPDLDEPVVMEPTIRPPTRMVDGGSIKPMFISIEDYQDILSSIGNIKDALHETEGAMSRLNELKNAQERILEDWRTHIEDAERKITYIDQVIFRGE
ncbi:MAG: hypothetical protein AABX47_02970 [Nanoarchaeota archaeon]